MDNIYKEGTFITAKSALGRKLVIHQHIGRIYYCKVVDDRSGKLLLAYAEKDLMPPMHLN